MQRLCDKYNRAIDSIHQLVSFVCVKVSSCCVCEVNVKLVTKKMNNTVNLLRVNLLSCKTAGHHIYFQVIIFVFLKLA